MVSDCPLPGWWVLHGGLLPLLCRPYWFYLVQGWRQLEFRPSNRSALRLPHQLDRVGPVATESIIKSRQTPCWGFLTRLRLIEIHGSPFLFPRFPTSNILIASKTSLAKLQACIWTSRLTWTHLAALTLWLPWAWYLSHRWVLAFIPCSSRGVRVAAA